MDGLKERGSEIWRNEPEAAVGATAAGVVLKDTFGLFRALGALKQFESTNKMGTDTGLSFGMLGDPNRKKDFSS